MAPLSNRGHGSGATGGGGGGTVCAGACCWFLCRPPCPPPIGKVPIGTPPICALDVVASAASSATAIVSLQNGFIFSGSVRGVDHVDLAARASKVGHRSDTICHLDDPRPTQR